MPNKKSLPRAEFIKPLNTLRTKVGYGGLNDNILNEAQMMIEYRSVDFQPDTYLTDLLSGIEKARNAPRSEDSDMLIENMLDPAINLKANGGMFGYPIVSKIGAKLIEFLDMIATPDRDAIEIVLAFHTTIRTVMTGHVTGSGGRQGDELVQALEDACQRYFEQYSGGAIKA